MMMVANNHVECIIILLEKNEISVVQFRTCSSSDPRSREHINN